MEIGSIYRGKGDSRFTVWAPFYEGLDLEHFPVAFLLGQEAE